MTIINWSLTKFVGVFIASFAFIVVTPFTVAAATTNVAPAAQVTFTFDDGLKSALTQAAPVLAKYNMTGTSYIPTGCIGSVGTCHADKTAAYMSWAQVTDLQNKYGWEIGAHTINHFPLTTLTDAQKEQELYQSKQDLLSHGFNATSFASPGGDYDMATLAIVAKYYSSHRGFWDQGTNKWPHSEYIIRVKQVQAGVSVASVKTAIDQAIANKEWLVLVFHDIKVKASSKAADYEYSTANLNSIASYVNTKRAAGLVKVPNIRDGVVTSDTNLFANGTFGNGISDGWTTDTPNNVQLNTALKGSYPEAVNSIKFVAGATNAHLFSPKVVIDPNATYMFKNFLDVNQLTTGEIGFYIDEYNAAGNWISGQWKVAERSVFVENLNFTYKATSSAVATTRLQVYATGNSGIVAYVDNIQMFPVTAVTIVTPPVEPPAPVEPPVVTSLIANSTFDAGLAEGWTTNGPLQIMADASNNGSTRNPTNSIKIESADEYVHLFSPKVAVASLTDYSITSYLDIRQISSGEVGFYIDEYDVAGNWISGQWKAAKSSVAKGDVSLAYSPSSVNVATASLQVCVTSNSNVIAYFDDVRWYAL